MDDLSPMAEIEQSVYTQLESSKKIFRVVQRLTAIASTLDVEHQGILYELTKELMHIGTEVSDNAEKLGKNLGYIILSNK